MGADMKPTYEECLDAACKWRGEYNGIGYELSWHGRSDYMPQGTWCWYIFVSSQQFYPDDWVKLRLEREDKQLLGSSWYGGWTWGEMFTLLSKDGIEYEQVKVGCDYAHYWDQERGYPDTKASVERDVKRSIDLLCSMFPNRRERCEYSGKFDNAKEFYTARNGRRVHKSQEQSLRNDPTWDGWLPATAQ